MKRLFSCILTLALSIVFTLNANAQNTSAQARKILEKTSHVIGRPGGISASFSLHHPTNGTINGSIAIKGNKFNARTSQAIVWFNGKTQWTYMKKNDEVNVTTPTLAQQQMMNPYTFINIYKKGYTLSSKNLGSSNEVHLVAQTNKQSIQEMYVTINKKSFTPSKIRMKHGGKWYNITIGDFSTKNQPNSLFTFNSKEFPTAEVIDLR